MEDRRWLNTTQPQTLQIAVFLLYINAVLSALRGALSVAIGAALCLGQVAAGFGIANEKKWGYTLGVVVSLLPFALILLYGGLGGLLFTDTIWLMFRIALVALLLHPQSREYQRIWFK